MLTVGPIALSALFGWPTFASAEVKDPPSAPATTVVAVTPSKPNEIDVLLGKHKDTPAAQEQARRRNPRPQPVAKPIEYIMDVELRTDPVTGGRCVYLFNRPGDPLGSEAAENELRSLRLVPAHGVCSNSPVAPRARPTPGVAAALAWERQVQLPEPALHIAPGWALTGKTAYLEVTGPRDLNRQYEALGYPIAIDATSTLDVDWGDGTVERGIRRRGGPWPDGDITHVYTDLGTYTVTVTQRWTANWRVGTQQGVIADRLVTTGSLQLEARQVQAVRNR